jgi:hypothetical protein
VVAMTDRFPQLGVIVDRGQVYSGTLAKGGHLGPLAGAHAELGEPTRHRRVGAAASTTILTGGMLGVAGLVPLLSKKSKALAFVVLASGRVRERKLDGNMNIRQAQSEAVRFNALAAAAWNAPSAGTQPAAGPRAQEDPRFTPEDHERARRAGEAAMRKLNGGK